MTRRTMLLLFALELSIVQSHGAQQDAWQSNSALGRQALAAGRAHEAQGFFEQALRTAGSLESVPGRRVFISTSDLAAAYQAQNKFAEAEALDRTTLEIARVAGIPDRELLPTLTNLAALLREMGRYAESESVYCRALTIAEREMAPDHAQSYRILRELAFLAAAQNRPEEAEQYYLRALEPSQSAGAVEADELVTTRSYLGDLYRNQGRYAESAAQYSQAMALLKQASHKDRLGIGVLYRLGQLAADQGNFRRAESLYRTALGEAQQTLGPENEQAAAILNNLGHLYTSKENYRRAKETLEQARAMWETLRLPENPEFATLLNNLGAVYYHQRKYAAAELYYQRALAIDKALLGTDHWSVARDLNNLGALYLDTRRPTEAESVLMESAAIARRFATASPLLAQTLLNLAELYRKQERYEEAEDLYQRTVEAWESLLGPENPEFARKLDLLATAYRGMAMYFQAGNLKNRAAAIRAGNAFQQQSK
ncbi:MAG: tetratricopeptide repeat protein [Acidobacteria bacterium]|nr:tetratricopeptide repeat protein [Acidobacteriota bacterium]